jgi:hypothetical protein
MIEKSAARKEKKGCLVEGKGAVFLLSPPILTQSGLLELLTCIGKMQVIELPHSP